MNAEQHPKPEQPTPRRFRTRGGYVGEPDRHWEEVSLPHWDRLNDGAREILMPKGGGVVFVREIP